MGKQSRLGMYLVFRPQQVKILAVDAIADEVHPVVRNTEIQVSKPEQEPNDSAGLYVKTIQC